MAPKWAEIAAQWTIKDVGAPLLDSLARGMYDALEVLREYVQNAIDSYVDYARLTGESPLNSVQIRVDPDNNALLIHDVGVGMNKDDVLSAKSIAVSHKLGRKNEFVGFRGIGIWSGLSACDRLEVTTSKVGDPFEYKLEIDCKKIVDHVYDPISIDELLRDRFHIYGRAKEASEHYTTVKLVNVHRERYGDLLDRKKLTRYAEQALPVPFDPKWAYAKDLMKELEAIAWSANYNITVDGQPILRRFPGVDQLKPPTIESIVVKNGKDEREVARAWVAETNREGSKKALDPKRENGEVSGFAVRLKNLALGKRDLFADADVVKDRDNLDWYVGEIYVTDDELVPDTNRRGFQPSHHSKEVTAAIQEFYSRTASRARGWSWEVLVREACADIDDAARLIPELLKEVASPSKPAKGTSKTKKGAARRKAAKADLPENPQERIVEKWIGVVEAVRRIEEAKTRANAQPKEKIGLGERAIREYLRKPEVKTLISAAEGKAAKLEALLKKEAPALKAQAEGKATSNERRKPKSRRRGRNGTGSSPGNGTGSSATGQSSSSDGPLVDLETVRAAFLAAAAAVVGLESDAYRKIASRLDEELRRRGIGLRTA